MTIIKKIKENLFFIMVVFAYIILFIISPSTGIKSIQNSGYYIKEMLLIMPVIFVLTALLDMWIPKEKITQYLGKEAKAKGLLLSFVVGSISAGPVYAAFPMCIMLYKKGASVQNIIIILSSWAVIKVPMLLNEAKFLGLKFMALRWILTIIAIILFSWISGKMIKENDIKTEITVKSGLFINRGSCIGCALCTKSYPSLFEMQGKKAIFKAYDPTLINSETLQATIKTCPVNAIEYFE